MRPITTEADLDALGRAAGAYATVIAWSHSGLLRVLADGEPRRLADLPGDPRALEITAPILGHLGLLVTDGERWALSATGRALLAAGALDRVRNGDHLGYLADLGALLSSGGPAVRTEIGVTPGDPDAARRFMDLLYRRSATSAETVARWLAPRLPAGGRVLDLGGGHGRYAHALAERGFAATVFDKPPIAALARERFGDTLGYLAGDFMTDDLGGPWDGILLSNIVHGLGPDECVALLGRLAPALAPGGVVVLKDFWRDDQQVHPENAVFFGLTMLLYTPNGRVYTTTDMVALCARAGLARAEVLGVHDEGYGLLFASR